MKIALLLITPFILALANVARADQGTCQLQWYEAYPGHIYVYDLTNNCGTHHIPWPNYQVGNVYPNDETAPYPSCICIGDEHVAEVPVIPELSSESDVLAAAPEIALPPDSALSSSRSSRSRSPNAIGD